MRMVYHEQQRFAALHVALFLLLILHWGTAIIAALDLDDVDAAASAAGFAPAHAVRILFPTPDYVYKGPLLHFEVISDAPFGPSFDHEIVMWLNGQQLVRGGERPRVAVSFEQAPHAAAVMLLSVAVIKTSTATPVSQLQEVTFSVNPELVVTSDVMRVTCPAANTTAVPPHLCNVDADLFSKPSLLLTSADAQKRCACASLLAVHMDVIAEIMTRVMPMTNHRQHPCSYPAQNVCNTLAETPMQRLARFVIQFASSAINDDAGGGNMYSSTSQQASCSDVLPRIDCWCASSSSSCPWEPLVNPHILQGILHDDPLPLSLASAVAEGGARSIDHFWQRAAAVAAALRPTLASAIRLSGARLWLGIAGHSRCIAVVGEVNDVAAALRLLPHAPCILVANSAEHVASVVAQTPRSHPAPVVHDLQALGRWGGCDDAVGKDACVAAMQMLLLGECSAMIGSLDSVEGKAVYSLMAANARYLPAFVQET